LLLENTNNSYNGPTIIPTGALELGASNVLPDTTILTLSGGDLEVFTNSDTIAKLVVTSANSAASTTGSGGKLTATNGYDLQASGTIAISLGGASAVTKTTAGVVDITGTNTYTGGTLLNGGTLRINSTTGLGAANSPVTFATGTTLSTSSTTARVLTYTWTVNGNITLGQNTTGTGTLTLAGAGGMNLGGATRVLTIANPADTISAVITNGGLTIDGGGTLTLSGANRYDGPTTINAGALTMSGANNLTGSITLNAGTLTMTGANVSTGPITITAGTMIVSGTNFCTGNTAVNGGELKTTTASAGGGSYTVADTATMSLAMTSASASLNVSSMTNGASTNNFDFARFGYPISRCISNAADLAVNGAVTVNVKGFDTNGTTTLIEYAGARSGAGNFVLGVVPPRVTASIDETITNKVILNTTASDTLIWVSDAVGNWDINNAGNKIWKLAAATTPAEYQENAVQGDTVRFDDTATNTTTVTVTVPVSPFNVTVDNTVTNYSFIGDGKISGTCSLTKNGTAELTITNANDFTGGTALNAGKLNIGNNAALGTGRLTINGGLIRSDSATARTLSVLTDLSGNLILGDAVNIGDITLSGASTIKGASRQVTVDTINATIS